MTARPPWKMPEPRDVVVQGCRTRYWDIGEGAPLVLVHGFSGSAAFEWGRVMDLLAQKNRVIALQVIGFEPSERPDIAYTTEALVGHLSAFMAALTLGDITLLGESFGGWLVASYAARVAQTGSGLTPIARLAIVGGAICMTKAPPPNANGFVDADVMHEVAAFLATGAIVDNDATREAVLRDSTMRKREPSNEDLARIAVPALLLWGDRDEAVPHDCGERAAAIIPKSQLVVLPNVGHIPSIEVPHAFARIVSDFASG